MIPRTFLAFKCQGTSLARNFGVFVANCDHTSNLSNRKIRAEQTSIKFRSNSNTSKINLEQTCALSKDNMESNIDFYYMAESPPCRAVEMVAATLGVKLNKHSVNLFKQEHLTEAMLKINPQHKVPFIVDGDLKLGESRAIITYLVSKFKPGHHLYPSEPKEKARIDEVLFWELGTLYQAASKLFRPKIFAGASKLNPDDEKAYREILHHLDKRLGDNGAKRFLLGDNLTVADISLSASFTLPPACGFDLHEFKNIVAYLERLKSAIPNYSEINGEPTENMRKFIQSRQKGE